MAYESIIKDNSLPQGYNKKTIFNAGVEATLDYSNPKKNYSPTIQLLFSPFGAPFVPIEVLGTNLNQIISSLSWTKDRNNPGGILQVDISPDASMLKSIVDIINKASFNVFSKIWGELGVDLEDLFKPMTLCQLWIDGYHVMTGTVRSCIRASSVTQTDKEIVYSVTIDELGNLYNLNTVSYDSVLLDNMNNQISDSLHGVMSDVKTLKGVSLAQGIKSILDAFKTTTLQQGITVSDGIPLSYRLLAESNPLGGVGNLSFANSISVNANMFKLNSSGGGMASVWSFLKSFVPSPWMELFTESGGRTIVTDGLVGPAVLFPGMNYVVSRSAPYSNPALGTVNPAHLAATSPYEISTISMLTGGDFIILTDDMIHEKSLGFDCVNQNTVFHARYSNGNAPNKQDRGIKSIGPMNPMASGGIGTFGIREMFQSIDCTSLKGLGASQNYLERIAVNTFGKPNDILPIGALSNLLAVWFRNQSRFREGSITCKAIPYARAGMYCLYLPTLSGKKVDNMRDIGIYYIDSLSHSYSLENDNMEMTTSLNLTRGVPTPTNLAQTALMLFDYETLPPMSGLSDGEYSGLKAARDAISRI